jgi:hypothetical protein
MLLASMQQSLSALHRFQWQHGKQAAACQCKKDAKSDVMQLEVLVVSSVALSLLLLAVLVCALWLC